jgi:hypothetical protein
MRRLARVEIGDGPDPLERRGIPTPTTAVPTITKNTVEDLRRCEGGCETVLRITTADL